MADATRSIFNKKATEKLHSPDDLDKYVQVTNPSVWVVLISCIALLGGLLAWGVFGAVDTNVKATGAVVTSYDDDAATPQVYCFLPVDAPLAVDEGDHASMGGDHLTVSSVQQTPVSVDEVKALLGYDHLVESIMGNQSWAYVVTLSGDVSNLPTNVPLPVSITVSRTSPISLILRGWE